MKNNWWIVFVVLILIFVGLWYKFSLKTTVQNPSVSNTQALSKGTYELNSQNVNYYENTQGYLAKPKTEGVYPGVVMIHESFGLNDYIKSSAESLASFGYSVLAVDLFSGKVANNIEETKSLVGSLDQELAILNMKAAVKYLRQNEKSPKVAAMGWGFGGSQTLKFSLSGEKLDATVIYYGDLLLEAKKLSPITWPVLGIFGEQDIQVPVESARVFDTVLTKLKTPHQVVIYPEAGFDFANPTSPNYSPKDSAEAWTKTVEFLEVNIN